MYDNYHSVKQRLKVMLAAVLVLAFVGALLTDMGWEFGIIAFVTGISACFPIIGELYCLDKVRRRTFNDKN